MSTRRAYTGNVAYDQAAVLCDRGINAKTVHCPTCGAEAGATCVTATGKQTGNHPTRRRMAIRALYDAGTLTASPHPVPTARQIYKTRTALGLSVRQLAEQIGVSGQNIWTAERGRRPTGDAASRLADWFFEATHRPPA